MSRSWDTNEAELKGGTCEDRLGPMSDTSPYGAKRRLHVTGYRGLSFDL